MWRTDRPRARASVRATAAQRRTFCCRRPNKRSVVVVDRTWQLKAIGKDAGGTINDVVVAAVGGALRKFGIADRHAGVGNGGRLPPPLTQPQACMWVSLRPIQVLVEMTWHIRIGSLHDHDCE